MLALHRLPAFRRATLVLLLAGLPGLGGCAKDSETEAAPIPTAEASADAIPEVTTIPVSRHVWPTKIRVHGSLIPDEAALLGAKVPGRVAEVLVDAGDVVEAGQPLMRLDTAQLVLEVKHAESLLAQACAAIGMEPHESTDDIVPDNSPVVRQEKALLDQAQVTLDRTRRLRQSGAATEEELTDAEAAHKVAAARYAASLNSLAEKVALIKVRRSELAVAENNLRESEIVAPFAGVVQQRSTAAGSYLREGDAVATIVRCDRLRFLGSVPEKHAHLVRPGQPVEVYVRHESEPRSVVVSRLRPVIDPNSRALMFEADVPNPGCTLQPGVFAEAEVTVVPDAQELALPASAVIEFAGVEKVWRVVDGQAEQVPIRTGESRGDMVTIVEGLKEGDEVVVDASRARAGQVRIAQQRS